MFWWRKGHYCVTSHFAVPLRWLWDTVLWLQNRVQVQGVGQVLHCYPRALNLVFELILFIFLGTSLELPLSHCMYLLENLHYECPSSFVLQLLWLSISAGTIWRELFHLLLKKKTGKNLPRHCNRKIFSLKTGFFFWVYFRFFHETKYSKLFILSIYLYYFFVWLSLVISSVACYIKVKFVYEKLSQRGRTKRDSLSHPMESRYWIPN